MSFPSHLIALLLVLLVIVSDTRRNRTRHELRSSDCENGNQRRGREQAGGEVFSRGGSDVHDDGCVVSKRDW